jgi:hypothetical protein
MVVFFLSDDAESAAEVDESVPAAALVCTAVGSLFDVGESETVLGESGEDCDDDDEDEEVFGVYVLSHSILRVSKK